jgi:hypothetical protein
MYVLSCKLIEQTLLKRYTKWQIYKEMFNIFTHKGNANQNDTKNLSDPFIMAIIKNE